MQTSFPGAYWLMALVTALSWAVGCGGALHQSGKDVASGAVQGSIEEVAEGQTRQLLVETLNDPETMQAVSNLTEAAAAGILDSLTEPERTRQLAQASDTVIRHFGEAFALSLDEHIRPVIARTIAQSVEASLQSALGPKAREQVEAMALAAVRGAMQGINEGIGGMQLTSLTAPVGEVARMAGREATLGVQDAVRIAAAQKEHGPKSDGQVLAAIGETADAVLNTSPWLVTLFVLLGLGVVAGFIWGVVRLRKGRVDQRGETAQAVEALSSALRAAERGVPLADIRSELERTARTQPNVASLRQAMRSWEPPGSRPGA